MSFNTSFFGQTEAASALRYGFSGLEPISIKNTVRKLGLKFTTVQWRFEKKLGVEDYVQNYPSYLKSMNELVFAKINLPSDIDASALAEKINECALEEFEKDSELKSALRKVEKEKESTKPFLDFINFMRKRYEEKEPESMRIKTEFFSCSNLPFSFLTDLTMSDQLYGGFLDAMQHKTTLYESVWLHKYANDHTKFREKFEEMKRSLTPLFDAIERASFSRKCLGLLVLGSNVKDVNSLSFDFIDIHKVDIEQFNNLSNEFRASLDHSVSSILSIEPRAFSTAPSSDFREVFATVLL